MVDKDEIYRGFVSNSCLVLALYASHICFAYLLHRILYCLYVMVKLRHYLVIATTFLHGLQCFSFMEQYELRKFFR